MAKEQPEVGLAFKPGQEGAELLLQEPWLLLERPETAGDVRVPESGELQVPLALASLPAEQQVAVVQAALQARGEALVVFDCYRPVRAVRHFVAWARDPHDQRNKARYYPNLDKSALLGVYIAECSGHSRGATLDVGLLRCVHGTDDCAAVDMGTPFDLFDPRANTAAPGLTDEQRANRERLLQAMAREGFVNYPMEWWHYGYRPEPTPQTAYDFPIR